MFELNWAWVRFLIYKFEFDFMIPNLRNDDDL